MRRRPWQLVEAVPSPAWRPAEAARDAHGGRALTPATTGGGGVRGASGRPEHGTESTACVLPVSVSDG